MKTAVYVHGKGGSASESAFYEPLFPGGRVAGVDYRAYTPWEAGREIRDALEKLGARSRPVTLIANSIGAFFCMNAGIDKLIRRAYFISPVVDMEMLIRSLMAQAGVTEAELEERGVIPTALGETLSWEYLRWVREHPIRWEAPTAILYGKCDNLVPLESITAFAGAHSADLTVMENGEHWFHTPEQLRFLADWIRRKEEENGVQAI